MVKKILLTLLQFCAFLGLLAVGGYWDIIRLLLQLKAPALNIIPLWKVAINADYYLILNGIIFAGVLLVLILLFEAARKALRPWALLSILAYVVAVVVALSVKLGLPPSH